MASASNADVLRERIFPMVSIRGRDEPAQGIDERMRHHAVPGTQVVAIEDGRIGSALCYGELERGSGRAVEARSLFQAASISKPVTALAVLRLVAEGSLDLDAPINDALRTWHLPENDETRRRPVTLRALLSHTAGTTVHGFPGYGLGADLPTLRQILDGEPPANTKPVRVDIPVGEQFRYSGGGTTIVQQLLTDITGRIFPSLMHDLVLGPVGMVDSTFEQPLPGDLRDRAATAHDEKGVVPGRWHVYPEMAAAGLWTTATDLARFAVAIQHAIAGDSGALIPPALARDMVTPQNDAPVGLGLQLSGMEGDRRFGHSGGNRGFHCRFVGFVEHADGIVVMTNGPFAGSPLLNEIIAAVGAAQGWRDFATSQVITPDPRTDDLERFIGDYQLRGITVAIKQEGARLVMTAPFSLPVEMHRVAEREFVLSDTTRVTFEVDGDHVVRATLEQWGDRYVATRAETGPSRRIVAP